jgi:hypothetical protein
MSDKDPEASGIVIPPDLNLFYLVNNNVSLMMDKISKLQVYIDDWATLPQDVKDMVKGRAMLVVQDQADFLTQLKDFIGRL